MRLHRYCLLLAVCAFFLVIAGAVVTPREAALAVHRSLGSVVGLLTVGLVLWLWLTDRPRWVRWLGSGALLLIVLQGLLGALTVLHALPPSTAILHACAAQIFLSLTAALAALTSPAWQGQSLALEDSGRPSLRLLAAVVPMGVIAQTSLGAAYRHGILGIMPHVIGAIVVTGLVLLVSLITLVQYGEQKAVAKPAKRLLVITLHQVVLGVLAYIARIITGGASHPGLLVLTVGVAHVAVGALTMAASVILAIQVWRNVHAPEPVTGQ